MCVPKNKIIPLESILNSSKKTLVMVLGQWLLIKHDGRKVCIPKLVAQEGRKSRIQRKLTRTSDLCWSGKFENLFVY